MSYELDKKLLIEKKVHELTKVVENRKKRSWVRHVFVTASMFSIVGYIFLELGFTFFSISLAIAFVGYNVYASRLYCEHEKYYDLTQITLDYIAEEHVDRKHEHSQI